MEIRPSFSEFELMAKKGNVLPVYREFLADTETPVSAYLKIRDKPFSYLLESANGGKKWGRYSFIGYKPLLTVFCRDKGLEIAEGTEKKIVENVKNPLEELRKLSRQFTPVVVNELSPFQGGFVGYFNYDLIRKWEYLPDISPEDTVMPEALFTVSRRLIIFDHLTHRIKVVAFVHLRGKDDVKGAYDFACQEVDETIGELQRPLSSIVKEDLFSLVQL